MVGKMSKCFLLVAVVLLHFIIVSIHADEGRVVEGERVRRSGSNKEGSGSNGGVSRPPDKSEASFATENSTVVKAQIGSTANLPCIVKNLGSGVASWIRRKDYHLLTVGMGTYSNDERFYVLHNRPNQNWELHVKKVKQSDEGLYECQISTHPPSSIFLNLRVVEAKAEILGEPDKHVRSGSTFELICVLRDSTEPPVYVFWYLNDRMINYDNLRGVVVTSDSEKSILTILEAQKTDSGNYTCVPSNASPTSISVHILNGEKPAAMQHGSRSSSSRVVPSATASLVLVISLTVSLCSLLFASRFVHDQKTPDNPLIKYEEEKEGKSRKSIDLPLVSLLSSRFSPPISSNLIHR